MSDRDVKAHMLRHMLTALYLNAAVRRSVTNAHLSPHAWVEATTDDMHAITVWHQHMWVQALLLRRQNTRSTKVEEVCK